MPFGLVLQFCVRPGLLCHPPHSALKSLFAGSLCPVLQGESKWIKPIIELTQTWELNGLILANIF